MSDPRAAAYAAGAAFGGGAPPQVRYGSCGAVLVAGSVERALPVAIALGGAQGLRVVAVVEGLPADAAVPRRITAVPGRVARVTGFLGRFTAQAEARAGPLDLADLSPNASGCFDVVIDLCEGPLCALEVEPIGYFRPAGGVADIESLIEAVRALSGETTKPQYVRYVESLCTHGAQGLTGCTRCLDACPAGALGSDGSRIAVETGLCRGCGSCTLRCPTGALAFTWPRARDLRARVRRMLEALEAAGGEPPGILFHGAGAASREAASRAALADSRLLPVEVPSLASVGSDTWLDTLAAGAAQVRILDDPELPATARRVLGETIEDARAMLAALGVDAGRLRLVTAETIGAGTPVLPDRWCASRPLAETGPAKRAALERSIEALGHRGGPGAARVALPAGGAFGTIEVDTSSCTMCLACARICPTGALAGESKGGTLRFTEAACVQCGLCAGACPEDAISLLPSMASDVGSRAETRLVNQVALAPCTRCGTPFMPRALLEASLAHLGGDVAANAQVAGMLEVCPGCRSQAAMREPFIRGRVS